MCDFIPPPLFFDLNTQIMYGMVSIVDEDDYQQANGMHLSLSLSLSLSNGCTCTVRSKARLTLNKINKVQCCFFSLV